MFIINYLVLFMNETSRILGRIRLKQKKAWISKVIENCLHSFSHPLSWFPSLFVFHPALSPKLLSRLKKYIFILVVQNKQLCDVWSPRICKSELFYIQHFPKVCELGLSLQPSITYKSNELQTYRPDAEFLLVHLGICLNLGMKIWK